MARIFTRKTLSSAISKARYGHNCFISGWDASSHVGWLEVVARSVTVHHDDVHLDESYTAASRFQVLVAVSVYMYMYYVTTLLLFINGRAPPSNRFAVQHPAVVNEAREICLLVLLKLANAAAN